MLTKEFISEFAKKKSDKKINKILSNIPHGSEPLIIFELCSLKKIIRLIMIA